MKLKKWVCFAVALLLLAGLLPQPEAQAYAAQTALLTFSDSGITETEQGTGYSVSGTVLTVTAPGTYRITGQCAEGSIVVGKELSGVTLILDDLTLSASVTAPLVVKKESSVLLMLEGESTLTDNEDASTEETNEDFEGACVKVKNGASLTVFGDGSLRLLGNAKNGMKGAALSALTVDGGTINVQAANNAVAFDGSVTVNAGSLDLTAGGDGIKAEPDETDAESAGTVTIRGGDLRVRAQSDGIHAKSTLTVTGGSFDIQTMDGYQTRSFNANTMSAKGMKCSGGDTEEPANLITITGGSFRLNTIDDAIHSDADVTITGGTFEIYTGDDGVHAEKTLTLGTENGYERDPEITVQASYEAMEGSVINAYSGKYYLIASDDGMNAAGGSSNGTDPGGPWGPGGGGGWGPGGGWGGPGGGGGFPGGGGNSGNYSMNFYGGSYYVDCRGDGLDSNGALNLYGGDFSVLSMASGGDNSPLDADGTMLVKGATVFGAGSPGMRESPASGSQKYYTDTTRRNAGTVVNVSYGGKVVFSETLVRNINYLFYSSPDMTSTSCTVATANAVTACQGNAWNHNWDGGVVQTAATLDSPGVLVYTCTACGATERKTIPQLLEPASYAPEETEPEEPKVYTAGFVTDGHAEIDLYYKQEYTQPDETNALSAVARNSATGEVDGTGDGQINFAVRLDEGYAVESIEVEGSYKNLKDLSEGGEIKNLYRVTKIAGDLTITVKTVKIEPSQCEHNYLPTVTAPTCTAQGYTTYTCSKCGDSYVEDYTAKIAHNYVGGVCTVCGEKLLNVTISCNEGVSVTVYATQDVNGAHTDNAVSANPRDSDSGLIDCSGDGQVNFRVVLADGYELEGVTAEPVSAYKNLKGPADTGMENGYRVTKIKDDLTVTVTAVKAACEHNYKALVTAPTCTEKGYTTYTCSKCGDSYVGDERAALGHSFGQWTTTEAATCTDEGEQTRTCARCGEKETRKTDALGHDYKAVVTAPTCTAKGYTTYTCSRCGDSYRDNETAALGHDYKAVVTAPTCTAKGYTTYTCSRCGDSYKDNETAALGHDWGTGVVTKEPTENEKGERTYTCARCGVKRTETIPELSHVHSYTADVTAPSCTEAGFTTPACSCGDSYVDTPVPALGHSFGGWTVTTAPTCTEKGEETRTCERCGAAETRETEALGHSFGDWAVTTAPTCTEKGEETRTCARCGAAETREVEAMGHDLVEHEAEAPTCTEPGWAAYQTCSRCDYSTYAALPALEHDFQDGVCTRCGAADPDYVPPVSYDALKAAIEEAEKLELEKYTGETVAALETALAAAREALKADKQADVDAAKEALEAAVISMIEKDKPLFRFDDVQDESQYYFTPVYWAVDNGITTGTSPTTFSPNAGCTRAQVVTFLWRAAGKPEPTTSENPFEDVTSDAYYYKAVLWAVEKGITTGTSATTFRPDRTCTRGQIVTFLWRYNGQPEPENGNNPFADVPAGQYYYKAVQWAVENGITKGTSADKFSPDSTCTRAQIVTFLYRDLA